MKTVFLYIIVLVIIVIIVRALIPVFKAIKKVLKIPIDQWIGRSETIEALDEHERTKHITGERLFDFTDPKKHNPPNVYVSATSRNNARKIHRAMQKDLTLKKQNNG